jgi:hypothetical protein
MSIGTRVAIPDILLKVTYGYAPNIRTITQPVSVSTLNLGLNSILLEDPKLLREIKANPELKLYPSVVINSTLSPNFSDTVVGQTYYPPEKTYSENILDEYSLNMFLDDQILPIFRENPLVGLLNDSIAFIGESGGEFGNGVDSPVPTNSLGECPDGYFGIGGGYCMNEASILA